MSWSTNILNASNAFTGSGVNGQVAYWNSATGLTSSSALLNNGTVAGVNATSSTINFLVQGTAGNNPFQINSSTGASLLTVDQRGYVGIGTSTPSAPLEVYKAHNFGAGTTNLLVLTDAPTGNGGSDFGAIMFRHRDTLNAIDWNPARIVAGQATDGINYSGSLLFQTKIPTPARQICQIPK